MTGWGLWRAVSARQKIRKERKGIGYPNSISFEKFIKTKKMNYRHMIYTTNYNYTQFTREFKFDIESINNEAPKLWAASFIL